jgi:hypothetical protein
LSWCAPLVNEIEIFTAYVGVVGTTKRGFFGKLFISVFEHQGIVGTGLHTRWTFSTTFAEIALVRNTKPCFMIYTGSNRTLRTSHYTHPASDTAILIDLDKPCVLIAPHGTDRTSLYTLCMFTDTTISGKGERTSHLDFYFCIYLWLFGKSDKDIL